MKNLRLSSLALIALSLTAGTARAEDILAKLKALPGVTVSEKISKDEKTAGLRIFEITIEQPIDHFNPRAGTFQQHLALLHKDESEPMVLQTSGYEIFGIMPSELAATFGTNQIQVEHRYFAASAPSPLDWSYLTVRQSAEDFHRIVQTFKTLYSKHWVNTGASKGGMTSIFFRRYFPNDLDGTLADVAPLSFTTEDPRYITFLDQVGGDKYAECRNQLESLQRLILKKRGEVETFIKGDFKTLGGLDTAIEHAVIEMPFTFWQYGDPENSDTGCGHIPTDSATSEELAKYLNVVNAVDGYGDTSLQSFLPYYYQSANELGAPGSKLAQLKDLLIHGYSLDQYLPDHKPVAYTDQTMLDVKNWVANASTTMMFVYGEYDPWSAGAYRDINKQAGSDNHWFLDPHNNHGSNFTSLAASDNAEALETLSRWLGKKPINAAVPGLVRQQSLENFEVLRKHGARL